MVKPKPAKGKRPSRDDIKAKAARAEARSKGEPVEKTSSLSAIMDPPTFHKSTKYTREIADEVCRLMAEGNTLNTIARMPGMPPRTTVIGWKNDDIDGFADRYARAREDLLDFWEDDTIDIADECRGDYKERIGRDGEAYMAFDKENVERSKLKVDTRKWMLAKLRNTKFGDKIEQTHKTDESFVALWKMMGSPNKPVAK